MNIFSPISFTIGLIVVSFAFVIFLLILKNYLATHITESVSYLLTNMTVSNTESLNVAFEYHNDSLNEMKAINSIYYENISKVIESVSACKINKESINSDSFLLHGGIVCVSDIFRKKIISFFNYYQQLFSKISFSKINNCDEKFADFCLYVKDIKPVVFSEGIIKLSKSFEDINIFLEQYTNNLHAIDMLFPYLNDYDVDKLVKIRKVDIRRLLEGNINFSKYIYNKAAELIDGFVISLNENNALTAEYLNILKLYLLACSLKDKNGINHNVKITFTANPENGSDIFYNKDVEIRDNYEIIKQCHYFLTQQDDYYIMHPLNLHKMKLSQIKKTYNIDTHSDFELGELVITERPITRVCNEGVYKLVQKGKIEFKK